MRYLLKITWAVAYVTARKEQEICAHRKSWFAPNLKMNIELMFSSKTDNWETPQDLFEELNKEFDFTLDPCADSQNHKCHIYFTKEDDGLSRDWGGHIVFCNPPYGREIGKWVKKAYETMKNAWNYKYKTIVVMLIPARTDTKWFHEYIYNKPNVEIRFLKGRLKFGNSKNSAPFPSMIVVFGGVADA